MKKTTVFNAVKFTAGIGIGVCVGYVTGGMANAFVASLVQSEASTAMKVIGTVGAHAASAAVTGVAVNATLDTFDMLAETYEQAKLIEEIKQAQLEAMNNGTYKDNVIEVNAL